MSNLIRIMLLVLVNFLIYINISNGFNFSPQPNTIFRQPVLSTAHIPTRSSYFGFSIVLRENRWVFQSFRKIECYSIWMLNDSFRLLYCKFCFSETAWWLTLSILDLSSVWTWIEVFYLQLSLLKIH